MFLIKDKHIPGIVMTLKTYIRRYPKSISAASNFDDIFVDLLQRVTGIPVPGNSRENQLHFFPLDLEK